MNNPYCASYENVRKLYIDHTKALTREKYDEWVKKSSREQVKVQLDARKGEVIDGIWKIIRDTIKQTEFVEFLAALQLADFYFPNEEKSVCFELKRNVKPSDIKSFEELIKNIENDTYIDCEIKTADQKISFQIKRDYSDHTPNGFSLWLNEKVFIKKYGDMKGTSLVLYLGVPTDGSVVEIDKFYEEFTKNCTQHISFDKVLLLYNDKTSGHIVLHEFFPKHKRLLIESDLAMSRFRGDA